MKQLMVFLAVFFSAFVAYGQQEAQAKAELQSQAVEKFLDRAVGVMRVRPESANALTTCGLERGLITFGVAVNSSFGDCFIAGSYIDFWAFNAQAGQQVRVTFSAAPQVLVTIQDYNTGDILADSKAGCGGGLCTSGTFTYTPGSSTKYLVGLGSFSSGTYTFTVTSGGVSPGGSNLTPFKPTGWSDKIVISKELGTHTDAASFLATDTLYVDYAVGNVGSASTGVGFTNQLFLDGALIRTGTAQPVDVSFFTFASDVVIGPLTAGTHTLRIKADSGNAVAETDETDNEYTRTFTVAGGGTSPCVSGATTLCLNSNRFKVTAVWASTTASGTASAVSLTTDTGYYWFFTSGNVEVVIKVVDGRAFNNRFWVFVAGLTNVNVVITVTDTQTGTVKTYTNAQGVDFKVILDTNAFPG